MTRTPSPIVSSAAGSKKPISKSKITSKPSNKPRKPRKKYIKKKKPAIPPPIITLEAEVAFKEAAYCNNGIVHDAELARLHSLKLVNEEDASQGYMLNTRLFTLVFNTKPGQEAVEITEGTGKLLSAIYQTGPKGMYQSDLAKQTGTDPRSLHHYLKRVIVAGLVEKIPVSYNRTFTYRLTFWSFSQAKNKQENGDASSADLVRLDCETDYGAISGNTQELRLSIVQCLAKHGTIPITGMYLREEIGMPNQKLFNNALLKLKQQGIINVTDERKILGGRSSRVIKLVVDVEEAIAFVTRKYLKSKSKSEDFVSHEKDLAADKNIVNNQPLPSSEIPSFVPDSNIPVKERIVAIVRHKGTQGTTVAELSSTLSIDTKYLYRKLMECAIKDASELNLVENDLNLLVKTSEFVGKERRLRIFGLEHWRALQESESKDSLKTPNLGGIKKVTSSMTLAARQKMLLQLLSEQQPHNLLEINKALGKVLAERLATIHEVDTKTLHRTTTMMASAGLLKKREIVLVNGEDSRKRISRTFLYPVDMPESVFETHLLQLTKPDPPTHIPSDAPENEQEAQELLAAEHKVPQKNLAPHFGYVSGLMAKAQIIHEYLLQTVMSSKVETFSELVFSTTLVMFTEMPFGVYRKVIGVSHIPPSFVDRYMELDQVPLSHLHPDFKPIKYSRALKHRRVIWLICGILHAMGLLRDVPDDVIHGLSSEKLTSWHLNSAALKYVGLDKESDDEQQQQSCRLPSKLALIIPPDMMDSSAIDKCVEDVWLRARRDPQSFANHPILARLAAVPIAWIRQNDPISCLKSMLRGALYRFHQTTGLTISHWSLPPPSLNPEDSAGENDYCPSITAKVNSTKVNKKKRKHTDSTVLLSLAEIDAICKELGGFSREQVLKILQEWREAYLKRHALNVERKRQRRETLKAQPDSTATSATDDQGEDGKKEDATMMRVDKWTWESNQRLLLGYHLMCFLGQNNPGTMKAHHLSKGKYVYDWFLVEVVVFPGQPKRANFTVELRKHTHSLLHTYKGRAVLVNIANQVHALLNNNPNSRLQTVQDMKEIFWKLAGENFTASSLIDCEGLEGDVFYAPMPALRWCSRVVQERCLKNLRMKPPRQISFSLPKKYEADTESNKKQAIFQNWLEVQERHAFHQYTTSNNVDRDETRDDLGETILALLERDFAVDLDELAKFLNFPQNSQLSDYLQSMTGVEILGNFVFLS